MHLSYQGVIEVHFDSAKYAEKKHFPLNCASYATLAAFGTIKTIFVTSFRSGHILDEILLLSILCCTAYSTLI